MFGELEQTRGRFTVDEPLVEAFGGRRNKRERCSPSSASAPTTFSGRPRTLSPGERTRAQLALLAAQGVNCLVLDEPTNHLDLPAIEELEAALAGYTGTVVLVTHDRRLLERFGGDARGRRSEPWL